MTSREKYVPGPANGAHVEKDGEKWTLVLVRELRHAPTLVWQALTDPAQLAEWAPFDADGNLGTVGPVTLSTVGTPQIAATRVTRAEEPKLLEYSWGGSDLRWELEALGSLTLGILAPIAAACIASEMLLFSGVHLQSGSAEHGQVVYWLIVAASCAFIAYGRFSLKPF
jgi:hypothetical protein